ncbi:hypothetical protein [Actinobacillus minor]|uniref:hypothetical protein n=1 Tax=Actinobacillus minor TaxID=51047 RepID=UPI0023F2D0B2|nr:hypothetical protein [Actinobacillus minor]MDD6910039.1 hypothetical protein [Actinobacillus minor]MDY4713322.1 hypothetical protein [Actinobacillus minor]MDY5105876.1 hypothetical protein [Actinobacillus minor]
MLMNFPQLIQDSWNFIRNRSQFSLFAIILLVAIQATVLLIMPNTPVSAEASISMLLPTVIIGIANVYVSLLLILNIKSINAGQYHAFLQNALTAFNKLLPAIGLYILMVLPLSFGLSSVLLSVMSGNGVSIISLPLLVMGIFIFMKLCLSIYIYLIEEYSFGQAVKFTWNFTKGKMNLMIGYCLIANVLPQLLAGLVSKLGDNIAVMIISFFISAFLSLFTTIFGFRFYQAIRQ